MIAYARASGQRALDPKPEPMTRDTIFDMASLTKPVATATSIMILIDEGKLRLEDRLVVSLPEFDNNGKSDITIEQLLRHRAGFVPDNPLADYEHGAAAAWQRIALGRSTASLATLVCLRPPTIWRSSPKRY
jgi:CubicO group peptidase (beta-lactamase class C family)